jgi:hypothetical protein
MDEKGEARVISYASRALSVSEKNYTPFFTRDASSVSGHGPLQHIFERS